MSYQEISYENRLLFEAVEIADRLGAILKDLNYGGETPVDLVFLRTEMKKRINANISKMELPDG